MEENALIISWTSNDVNLKPILCILNLDISHFTL